MVNKSDVKDMEILHRNAPCNDTKRDIVSIISCVSPKTSDDAKPLYSLKSAIL
jgi:hypothetical protein